MLLTKLRKKNSVLLLKPPLDTIIREILLLMISVSHLIASK